MIELFLQTMYNKKKKKKKRKIKKKGKEHVSNYTRFLVQSFSDRS